VPGCLLTDVPPATHPGHDPKSVVPVFFLSDSTGISAETMGNALLIQFPDLHFERTLIPFISTIEQAREVVGQLDEAMAGPVVPLVFSTAAVDEVREELLKTRAPIIDFFGIHMGRVEAQLGARGLDRADVVLLAPSRCGKTPTAMYLALQHGLFVANYPLVDEDLETTDLPRPVRDLADRCFGLTTTVARLSRVRQERRPDSRYASEEQCRFELRRATAMYDRHHLPTVDTSAASVEEIAAVVIQTLARQRRDSERPPSGHDLRRGRTPRP
jgi:regulator of PEP synthase PpsR (kinase-PPPase family)